MLDNISFGQFYPARSFIHSMDGRMKILLTIAFIVFIFVSKSGAAVFAVALALIFMMALSRVPIKTYLRNIKAILPIIILTAVLNLLYAGGGRVLFSFWVFNVSTGGIRTSVYMVLRIVMLIMSSSIMTNTTSPTELTDSIESLLSPLKLLRLDIHSLAMMMSIALRFVPTLMEETDKIMSSQKARGADMESGGILRRVKALVPVLIPLLISSFRRAAELADAMECRCYHGGDGRTRLKKMTMGRRDLIAALGFAVLLAVIILCNVFLSDSFVYSFFYRLVI